MSQSKHTKGPWHKITMNHSTIIAEGNTPYSKVIARLGGETLHYNGNQFDAALIAAAPELLEACNTIFKLFVNTAKIRGNDVVLELSTNPDDIEMEYDKLLNLMSNAIKKAEGES